MHDRTDLDAAYAAMAADAAREHRALAWAEELVEDDAIDKAGTIRAAEMRQLERAIRVQLGLE